MKRIHASSVSVILIAGLLLSGCSKEPAPVASSPPVVLVIKAEKADVPIFSDAVATLEGSTNSQIYAQRLPDEAELHRGIGGEGRRFAFRD
jgi:PBP1b-binding outer membrane lipoprotein LpoB